MTLGALAAVGLAGCSETDNSEDEQDQGTPTELTESFYTTLYDEKDIEGTNELYHPESPVPDLTEATFEPFGGLENIETEVQSTEVVSQNGSRAVVHADVEYTMSRGSTMSTDYLYLRKDGEAWRINKWLAEARRRQLATQTVTEFYTTLYDEKDIEATNAMFHPESPASELTPATFEPYGGLESIETTVQSSEVVSEGGGEAEVHADIEYTTPNGTSVMTDYMFLKLQRGEWKIDRWVPEAVRGSDSNGSDSDGSGGY